MQNDEITISMEEYRYLLECKAIVERGNYYTGFLEETLRQTIHEALCGKGGVDNECN